MRTHTVLFSVFILWINDVRSVVSIERTKVLNDGTKIPRVALATGTGIADTPGTNLEDLRNSVVWAIESKYYHIDSASVYNVEQVVGEGIAEALNRGLASREELYITTKLWSDKHREHQVVPALLDSLKALRLKYVDLYLVHFPVAIKADGSPDDVDYLETWKGMEAAVHQGHARSIGVANFNITQLDRLMAHSTIKPAVNQIEVNPTNTQEAMVHHCQSLGVAVMAFSPCGYLMGSKEYPPPRHNDPKIVPLVQKYNKTANQIALRYLIQRDLIVIPQSTNEERIKLNVDIFDFELTPEEMSTMGSFNTYHRMIPGHEYKDFPNYPFHNIESIEPTSTKPH